MTLFLMLTLLTILCAIGSTNGQVPWSSALSSSQTPLVTKPRHLVGGGPSNPTNISKLAFGYHQMLALENATLHIMDEIKNGLQYLFQTNNEWTLAIPGHGSVAMETVLDNLLEPGDIFLVFQNGYWGGRIREIGERLGADVRIVRKNLNSSFSLREIETGIKLFRPSVVFLLHGESSIGVIQQMDGVGDLCRNVYNCLLIVDAVATVGVAPFYMDAWKIDAVYCNTQKGIGAPVGLAPLSYGLRAVAKIKNRKRKVVSYRNDLNVWIEKNYWQIDKSRRITELIHSMPVLHFYSLREQLVALATETLESAWTRHQTVTQRIYNGIEKLGLGYLVPNPKDRLTGTVWFFTPRGITDDEIKTYFLEEHSMEIVASPSGIMRVGLLGNNARLEMADKVLMALQGSIDHFTPGNVTKKQISYVPLTLESLTGY